MTDTAFVPPFNVWPENRPNKPFTTLEAAHEYARKLRDRDDVQSAITDGAGRIAGTYEIFGAAS